MKLSILITLFLATQSLAGNLKVGDQATYSVKSIQGPISSTVITTQEVVAINETSQMVSVKSTTTQNGSVLDSQISDSPVDALYFLTDAEVEAECVSSPENGTTAKMENIRVKAGSFYGCHFSTPASSTQGASDYYVGSVPFGLLKIKSIESDGSSTEMELISYRK